MDVSLPLVSIITPTWHRHDLLLNRCAPSVWAQTYPAVEHIIVSDGPDPELSEKLFPPWRSGQRSRWFASLPVHEEEDHWGHLARLHGIECATGELIGYCDDDDALRPDHVQLLASILNDHPDIGWVSSLMASHSPAADGEDVLTEIGHGPPSCGNIGTPMILHRREILEKGTWGPASSFEDWELVNRWIQAGVSHRQVGEVTIDVWPSLYYGSK